MMTARRVTVGLALALLLSGCAGQLATDYCSRPVTERGAYRVLMDARTYPNQIRVLCYGEQ